MGNKEKKNKHLLLGGWGRDEEGRTRGTPDTTHSRAARRHGPGRGQTPPEQQRAAARTALDFPGRRASPRVELGPRDPRASTRSWGARGATHPSLAGPAGARPGARARGGPVRLPGLRAAEPSLPGSCPRRPGPDGPSPPPRAPRTARAGPLELRSRPAAGGLARGPPAPVTRSRPPGDGRGAERDAGRASRGRSDRRTEDGRAGARTGSATRAAPLPQRRRRAGPCCCCQLVGRTLSMRARGPHPGNFRVWPFSPAALLSPGCPRLPPRSGRVPVRRRPRAAAGCAQPRPRLCAQSRAAAVAASRSFAGTV